MKCYFSFLVKIQVPWGEIRGSRWGDPTGIRVLAVHGRDIRMGLDDCIAQFLKHNLFVMLLC